MHEVELESPSITPTPLVPSPALHPTAPRSGGCKPRHDPPAGTAGVGRRLPRLMPGSLVGFTVSWRARFGHGIFLAPGTAPV